MDILERLAELDRGSTHWEGCEESHIRCACAKAIRERDDRIVELERELAEARKDTAHVDFLESLIHCQIQTTNLYDDSQPNEYSDGWEIEGEHHSIGDIYADGESLRSAIDAAREAGEGE